MLSFVGISPAVRTQLHDDAAGKMASIVKSKKHRAKIPKYKVDQETDQRIDDMCQIMNSDGFRTFNELLPSILELMIQRDEFYLIDTALPEVEKVWARDPKVKQILKDMRGFNQKKKWERLAQNPEDYIDSADEDPWESHVLIYVVLGGQVPYRSSGMDTQIPAPLWQLFAHLRHLLCQRLKSEYQAFQNDRRNGEGNITTRLKKIAKVYNEAPHPHEHVNIDFFRQTCAG